MINKGYNMNIKIKKKFIIKFSTNNNIVLKFNFINRFNYNNNN